MNTSSGRVRDAKPPVPFIVEPSSGRHSCSFILLHGLGSNGEEFGRKLLGTGICSSGLKLTEIFADARFIFPTSRRRRSSAFHRAMLTQWFDIASLRDPSHNSYTQAQGLEESCREIMEIIKQESKVVSREKVVLGGISQGCAMGLVTLLALDFPIGAFIGMSGWLPFAREIEQCMHSEDHDDADDNPFGFSDGDPTEPEGDSQDVQAGDPVLDVLNYVRDLVSIDILHQASIEASALVTPIFLGHGDADEKILPSLGEGASQILKLMGFQVEWKSYPGQGHWYKTTEEFDDILDFMESKVGWAV